MMKTWWAALCAAGMLTAGQAVGAAEPAVAPLAEKAAVQATADDDHLAQLANEDFSKDAFLDDVKLSETVQFAALRHPETGALLPAGQLQAEKDGCDMTAYVFPFICRDERIEQYVGGIFTPNENGNVSEVCLRTLEIFNEKLAALPLAANMGTVKAIETLRQTTGKDIPYSTLYMDFRSMESLHLLRAPVRVATTGARIFLYADGWVIPMYVKGYVWKMPGGEYRLLFALMADNEKDILRAAADDLALAAARVR